MIGFGEKPIPGCSVLVSRYRESDRLQASEQETRNEQPAPRNDSFRTPNEMTPNCLYPTLSIRKNTGRAPSLQQEMIIPSFFIQG